MSLQYDPAEALEHLARVEPRLASMIDHMGGFDLQSEADLSPYQSLLRAIVYQQLHGKAAGSIHARLKALFPRNDESDPEQLLALSDDQLRGAGLSRNKVIAARDLAARTLDGTVPAADEYEALDDEAVIERISCVRGVGRWTVEMLLIFNLGRPDVLPVGDFGIRKGYQRLFDLDEMPTPKSLLSMTESWRPYRSAASWYLWRATETLPGP